MPPSPDAVKVEDCREDCRCIFDESPVRGASQREERERGGAIGRGVTGTGSYELPSFRPRNGGEILRAAIIHYKVTSA